MHSKRLGPDSRQNTTTDYASDMSDLLGPNGSTLKYDFQYFMIVEISLNNQAFEPKLFTGIRNSFEVGERLVFPLRYCDLSPVSILGISIYDMKKPYSESLVGSTTIDLFD
jgi:hypothetical protein